MKAMVPLVCTVLLLTTFSIAQDRPALTAQPNTIFVAADGKFESPPDTALIQFNISTQADSSKDAYDQASKAAETVRQVLRANGIDPKTAEIGFLSVYPVYDYKSSKPKVVAYRVTTNVTLKLKEFSKVGPITQQLADANVSENQTLNYTLENTDEAKGKAVADAFRRARASAQALAAASGRTLGELSYASVDTFENIRIVAPLARRTMPMAAMGATQAPTEEFTPQNVTVTAHVSALFGLK